MAKNSKAYSIPEDRSKIISLSGVLAALVAVLTFIIIPVPPPVGGFDASSILILSLPILLGPELGMVTICLGEFVGTMFLLAAGLALPYYLPGIVAVRGPEAYFVGKIGRSGLFGKDREGSRQFLAMIIGPIWETFGFIAANYYIYYFMAGPEAAVVVSVFLLTTLIDLLWVAFAAILVSVVRIWLRTTHLEEQFGLQPESATKKKLFRISAITIITTWILLLLVPFVFTSWFG
jgi:uncharacterized membrane protein